MFATDRDTVMERPTPKPLRILAVDNDRDTLRVFQRILTNEGYQVSTADGFDDALTLARANKFDVLLCDIGLSERDGCALLAEIRAIYKIRAIAVTGHGTPDDLKRYSEAGFDGFLIKPTSLEQIQSALLNVDKSCDESHPFQF
jgi:CheY-like chemotaxis protein